MRNNLLNLILPVILANHTVGAKLLLIESMSCHQGQNIAQTEVVKPNADLSQLKAKSQTKTLLTGGAAALVY